MKKVYWGYSIDDDGNQFPDDFIEVPKKFRSGYDSRYDHSKCPAWKKWTENCWTVTQPFTVGMRCDTKAGKLGTDLTQKAYNQYFHLSS